jgi:chromatin remodeling complex protein RSC6
MSVPNLKSVYDSIDFSEEVAPPSPSSQSSNSDSEVAEISTNHRQQMDKTKSIIEDILSSGNALTGGGKKTRRAKAKKTPAKKATGGKRKRSARKSARGGGKAAKAAKAPRKKRDMTNHPFMKPHLLSQELQQVSQFSGVTEMRRPHVVRELWTYIKARNLQDPLNKRNIKCDAALQRVFGKAEVNMFEMQKLLNGHLRKIE